MPNFIKSLFKGIAGKRDEPEDAKENVLQQLKDYDTVIIMDDSGSMAGDYWNQAGDALSSLAEIIAKYDSDGLDLYFFNNLTKIRQNLRTKSEVKGVFKAVSPNGGTPMGVRVRHVLYNYIINGLARYPEYERIEDDEEKRRWEREHGKLLHKLKPLNLIVVTDGVPKTRPEVVIRQFAQLLDDGDWPLTQVGIQFVQIGDDKAATQYLQFLDNELKGIRDIVDTTPYGGEFTTETLLEALIGGINRRVDKRGAKGVLGED
ncbi:hypothetical protein DL96DRAFT_485483 [Flagelloscypha sp. PMI_526]|nr:hypothetical protein DL96DRAFT_485483 [Flagelloscypha sp. PMI_526]